MRWIGFDWDQVGREHMVARITGMRNAGQMSVRNTPPGTVPAERVLWVETGHPRYHELQVTWRIGGPRGTVLDTHNSHSLDLDPLDLPAGTVVHVEVRDPVGPGGTDWVRNPSTGNASTNSGYNGPRFVQTRQWTVGQPARRSPPAADITASTVTTQPVAGDEVVRDQPPDRSHPERGVVVQRITAAEPAQQPQPRPRRPQPTGGHAPAGRDRDRSGEPRVSDRVEWTVDNAAPTAPGRCPRH